MGDDIDRRDEIISERKKRAEELWLESEEYKEQMRKERRKKREEREKEREKERERALWLETEEGKEWIQKEREREERERALTRAILVFGNYTADNFRKLTDEQFKKINAQEIAFFPPDVRQAYYIVLKEKESKRDNEKG